MKQHLLIVDDEEPIRNLLSEYFKKRGYAVTVSATAADAERTLNEVSIHLAILDVLLPDDDGMFLLARIKGAHPSLPVIILTGIGFDEELLREAQQKGAAGFVSKTLPLDQLLMEVKRTLRSDKTSET